MEGWDGKGYLQQINKIGPDGHMSIGPNFRIEGFFAELFE